MAPDGNDKRAAMAHGARGEAIPADSAVTVTFARVAPIWRRSLAPGTGSLETVHAAHVLRTGDPGSLHLAVRRLEPPATPSEAAKADGEAHADYRLVGEIGAGGMGQVHAARQAALDRLIAIKTIHADSARDLALRQRFIVEARVTGDLQHPNIVPLIELAQDQDGGVFFSMRRIEGKPWSTVIDSLGPGENIEILLKVCDAVAYAYSRGVIHRDLKPENVMIGDYGEVLVMDWGLATRVAIDGFAVDLDLESAVAGTPAYLAPEMALGLTQRIGVRSDIYLLGGLLYRIVAGAPPHRGRRVMECLEEAAENRIGPFPPGEYARIARMALAPHPEGRHASVKAFQSDLRDCQTHAQSVAVAERAVETLAKAETGFDYADFARAVFGFEEAVRLWSGNDAARAGLTRARCAYAECAIGRGDLDLAAAQLDPGEPAHHRLVERLGRERTTRVAATAANARLAEVQARIVAESSREWQLVFADDFSDPAIEQRWKPIGCRWEHHPGELRVWGGQPAVLLLRQPVVGDVRIEFECFQPGPQLNDVSCFLAARPDDDPIKLIDSAYQVKYGAWDNTRNVIYRPNGVLWDQRQAPLAAGRRYRVGVERRDGRITLEVDGEVVGAVTDPEPSIGSEGSGVGLLGWVAETRYRAVRIYRLGAPLKADLLETAQRHLALNHYTTAADLFADALATAGDPARQACAQAGLARANMLRDLNRELPGIRARIAAHWPQAQLRIGDHGLLVDCSGCGIEDLSPLRGLPVCELQCGHNRIVSLEPLRGMAIVQLNCEGNRIADLAPLRGMPLQSVFLFRNQIRDLSPLQGAPLRTLHCGGNPVSDLSPLRGMGLQIFSCDSTAVSDLSPLRGMGLQIFSANASVVADLSPLAGMPLTTVQINHCRVVDLSPLRGAPLVTLEACGNRIADLSALRGAPLLRAWLWGNRIAELSPLRGAPLVLLDASCNPLLGIAPLSDRPPGIFLYDGPDLSESALHEAIAGWSGVEHAVHRRDAEVCLALRRGERAGLRALATRRDGVDRLLIPRSLPWPEAAALCERLGGRLAVIRDEAAQEAVAAVLHGHDAWIGLQRGAEGDAWITGAPAGFTAWCSGFVTRGYQANVYMTAGGHWAEVLLELRWPLPFVIEWEEP